MNFQFYVEKLQDSKKYIDFIKEHSDAYFCSGFFVVDKEGRDNKASIDFYLSKKKKILSFSLESGVEPVFIDFIDSKTPEKMSLKLDFDLDEIEELIKKEMGKHKINAKISKIMVSLQRQKGSNYLICTVFISKLGLLKVSISLKDKKIQNFEKKSFFDLLSIKKSGKNVKKK